MKAKTSYSLEPDAFLAAASVATELRDSDPRMVLYFASSGFDPNILAPAMKQGFPSAAVVGCSTAGELVSGRMLERSLVAMALGPELVERADVVLAERVSEDPRAEIRKTLQRLESAVGSRLRSLQGDRTCGLVLFDGLCGVEEVVMDELGNHSDVTFVGGSAGDDLQFKKTHLYVDGRACSDAAVLVLMQTRVPCRVLKTQSFQVLPAVLTATKVRERQREVLEFNGRPAAAAYAEALGVPVSALASQFMKHPLGLLANDEPFVRSPQAVTGDGVRFYCRILEGMELHILESTDIVTDTARALASVAVPHAFIEFQCILRTLELRDKKQCGAYGALSRSVPTVGFSTYGEDYIGHINQTSTILALGA